MIQTFVAAGNCICKLLGHEQIFGCSMDLCLHCAFVVMHIGKTGTSDLVGKICPQALLRELPLDVLAEHRYVGQIRDAAEIGPPSRRPDPHLMSFH